MHRQRSVLLMCFAICVSAKNIEEGRNFGNKYTKTVVKPFVVTSLIPSSCVQVDATLPPCRTVRSFGSFPSFGITTNNGSVTTNGTNLAPAPKETVIETTPLSWGEYLGFYAPTVTVTSTQVIVTTAVDPRVLVTFSVKGCRPAALPLGLDRCPPPENVAIAPTATSQPIQATATALPPIVDNHLNSGSSTPKIQLEGSSTERLSVVPTGATPTVGLDTSANTQPKQ